MRLSDAAFNSAIICNWRREKLHIWPMSSPCRFSHSETLVITLSAVPPHKTSNMSAPQEHGVRRLRAALTSNDSVAFTAASTVPLLNYRGCPALCKGSCKMSLIALLTEMYQSPGLLACLQSALEMQAITVNVSSPCSLAKFLTRYR